MLTIPPQKFKETLVKEGLITAQDFDNLLIEAERMGQNMTDLLISQGIITPDYFYNLVAKYFSVEIVNLGNRPIEEDILRKLSEELARQKRVIVFAKEPDATLDVAMEDPSDLGPLSFLKKISNQTLRFF